MPKLNRGSSIAKKKVKKDNVVTVQDIVDAIKSGEKKKFLRLMKEVNSLDLDLDVTVEARYTCLMLAAERGQEEMCKALLTAGANVDATSDKDLCGRTALYHVVETAGKDDKVSTGATIQIMLDAGADVNFISPRGEASVLHEACANGNHKVVELLLLKAKAIDVNTRIKTVLYGKEYFKTRGTPLNVACSLGHTKVVEFLLDVDGIDVNAVDSGHETSLQNACWHGHTKIVQLLLKKESIDIDVAGRETFAPLTTAVQKNHQDITQMLLNCGACIHTSKAYAYGKEEQWFQKLVIKTASRRFMKAAENGNTKEVKAILALESVDANVYDQSGRCALHAACFAGKLATVKHLLKVKGIKKGAPNAPQSLGWTPLHSACFNSHLGIVKLLLKEKAGKVNEVNKKTGDTSLHIVAGAGEKEENVDLIKFLLKQKGIKVALPNHFAGDTPLHIAIRMKNQEVAKLLMAKKTALKGVNKKNGDTILHAAIQCENNVIVRLLLKKSAVKVNGINDRGDTPLHFASKYGNEEVMKLLLKKKGKVNVANKDGNTPLHLASTVNVATLLLKKKAKVDQVNNDGQTALDLAKHDQGNPLRKKVADVLSDEAATDGRTKNKKNENGNMSGAKKNKKTTKKKTDNK